MVFSHLSFLQSPQPRVGNISKDARLSADFTPSTCYNSTDYNDLLEYYQQDAQPLDEFPRLSSHTGYIDTGHGNTVNYRTGSFNLGSDSGRYHELYQPEGTEDSRTPSLYDNVPHNSRRHESAPQVGLTEADLLRSIQGFNITGNPFLLPTELYCLEN